MPDVLEILDQLAGIATAAVALLAWSYYRLGKLAKKRRLETYLREADSPYHGGSCSLLQLVADLGMSETDIMDAAFNSSNIGRDRQLDSQTGLTTQVMLHYKRDPPARH